MNRNQTNKRSALKLVAGVAFSAGFAVPALAATTDDHWDKFSCYAYVHDQCYANGQNNCSDDDYNWGLDECDGYYPSAQIKKPSGKFGLATKKSSARTMSIIKKSFR